MESLSVWSGVDEKSPPVLGTEVGDCLCTECGKILMISYQADPWLSSELSFPSPKVEHRAEGSTGPCGWVQGEKPWALVRALWPEGGAGQAKHPYSTCILSATHLTL